VFWSGAMSGGPPGVGNDPFINIELANGSSLITDGHRPDNREWHEFGHHVMADMFGNRMPQRTGANHGGYDNPTTTDSWNEGFAEF